jgi:hypothetical protein
VVVLLSRTGFQPVSKSIDRLETCPTQATK